MKPVFWSTGAQTALAEAEVEYQDREDTAVYVKFPIVTGPLDGQGEHRHLDDDAMDVAGESRDRGPSEGTLRRCRNSRRDGRSETLVLADKSASCSILLPRPACEPTGEPLPDRFPAASSKASARSIHFCRAPRSF